MPWIKVKYDGRCKNCDGLITAGEKAFYDGKIYCFDCAEEHIEKTDGTP